MKKKVLIVILIIALVKQGLYADAIVLNNTITTGNSIDENRALVNDALINRLSNHTTGISNADSTMFENIANSNADANGDGVYYARAYLRKLIVDHNVGYLRQGNTTDTIIASSTIQVYPNPVDISNQIIIETPQQTIKTITIYDVTGRLVLEQNFTGNVWTKTMDVSSLNAGMFYVKVATINGNMLNSTFIKLK